MKEAFGVRERLERGFWKKKRVCILKERNERLQKTFIHRYPQLLFGIRRIGRLLKKKGAFKVRPIDMCKMDQRMSETSRTKRVWRGRFWGNKGVEHNKVSVRT